MRWPGPAPSPPTLFQTYEGTEKYGVVGGGGGVVPFCAAEGGEVGRQRQPAEGQVTPAPSCCWAPAERNGLFANNVLGRLAFALTVTLTQSEMFVAIAHDPWT